jgi:WD40 repeat protein
MPRRKSPPVAAVAAAAAEGSDDEYDPSATAVVAVAPQPLQAGPASAAAPVFAALTTASVTAAAVAEAAAPSAGAITLRGHSRVVRGLAMDAQGRCLVSGGADGAVLMWDAAAVATDMQEPVAAAPSTVGGAALPEAAGPRRRRLLAIAPTRRIEPFPNRITGHQPIAAVAWLRGGAAFVACQDGPTPIVIRRDGKTLDECVRGLRHATDVVTTKGHTLAVTSCAASPTSNEGFATGAMDGTARVWDTRTVGAGQTFCVRHGGGKITDETAVLDVGFASGSGLGGEVLYTAGSDGQVQFWPTNVRYRPGGAALTVGAAAGCGSSTALDSWASAAASTSGIVSACVSAHQPHHVATRTADGTVRVYDLRRGNTTETVAAPILGLPVCGSSAPLRFATVAGAPSLVTVTSAEGYGGRVGGHLVIIESGAYTVRGAVPVSEQSLTALALSDAAQEAFLGAQGGGVHAMPLSRGAHGGRGLLHAMKAALGDAKRPRESDSD